MVCAPLAWDPHGVLAHNILEVLSPDSEVGKRDAIHLVLAVWDKDDPCSGGMFHAKVLRELREYNKQWLGCAHWRNVYCPQ